MSKRNRGQRNSNNWKDASDDNISNNKRIRVNQNSYNNDSSNNKRIKDQHNEISSNNKRARIIRNPQDIERENARILSYSFNSSELSFEGSDKIVFITHDDVTKSYWRRMLKKEFTNQHQIRRFINSCLIIASENAEYELDDLIVNLSESEGRQRLRDIMMFPTSVDAGLQPQVSSFQRVILPFFALLTRSRIIDSTLERNVNAIYSIIYDKLDDFIHDKVIVMLETLIRRNSLADQQTSQDELLKDDPNSFIPSTFGQFFLVIVRLCHVFLNRIKNAASNETMFNIVKRLEDAKVEWKYSFITRQVNCNDPLYSDFRSREYFFYILNKEIETLKQMMKKHLTSEQSSVSYQEISQIADLKRFYEPPGELSKSGPRHNNDFSDISKISIIPTNEEMLSGRKPFLPTNISGSPHFLPEGAARLLDSQFRLLREDMLSPIRGGIINFLQFLSDSKYNKTKLRKLEENGGRYQYENGQENGDLYVYVNVRFVEIIIDKKRGFLCRISFTAPKNSGKNEGERLSYWQNSKKLMNGNLICLLWPTEDTNDISHNNPHYSLYFGVVVQREEEKLAKYEERIEIDISFTNATIYPLALKDISKQKKRNIKQNAFILECTGVYLESYYHILKTLQNTKDSILPFERYLTLAGTGNGDEKKIEAESVSVVDIPDYARAPGFHFDLSVLLHDKRNKQKLHLNVASTKEHRNVIRELTYGSFLDKTQAKALVSSLCKEIALIEGPPGTGKTILGVEIIKVLLAKENRHINLTPILVICFTNHALDQFLEHLIDKAKIDNIVRIGGRSKSDKISPFNLEEIVRNRDKPMGIESYLLSIVYNELESIQKDAEQIQKKLSLRWLCWSDVSSYLYTEFNEQYDKLLSEPEDLSFLLKDKDETPRKGVKTVFDKWLQGLDIINAKSMIQAMNNPSNKKKMNDNSKKSNDYELKRQNFLSNWQEPKTNRPLEALKNDTNIWGMSKIERVTLHDLWKQELNLENVEKLAKLQKIHDEKRKEVEDIHNERRKKILKNCDVIGMTTNGAAKFQSLIRSVSPKIILCEEAGEVLEAHILSALTPSTQHLILIGDHNQLRPHIATYNLRCDSPNGKKYGLDESLFERLVKGNRAARIEKSRLLIQRRMRSCEISDLIRFTLYKDLEDDIITTKYPKVRGAQHNVYFINHRNREDKVKSEFAIQSHSNQYEVNMVIELVKYFVRNGYTRPDDIAVLTPYLGQMIKLRDALKELFTVVIDERDSQNLAEMEDGNENKNEKETENSIVNNFSVTTKKPLNQQVTLRTVDNFQGEEANIVIISLVRNSNKGDDKGTVGFLKSTNRSNVLLSRAKHGMYLFGNVELMANESPKMWAKVIQILKSRNQIGDSFPIYCPQHINNRNYVKESQQFAEFAPHGGCLENCGVKLDCGHICPYKCHSDNRDHINVFCRKPCTRLHPLCNHPCNKYCGDKCGACSFVVGDIILPSCHHIYPKAKCFESRNISSIRCREKVLKTLPRCGHKLEVRCYESVDDIICSKQCDELNKCGHKCSAPCDDCQKRSIRANNNEPPLNENGHIIRNKHRRCRKVCERNFFCGHKCDEYCHEGRECKPCRSACTVSCSHSSCKLRCFIPCASCAEPCDWSCLHDKGSCLLSCGAPCSRLPCNLRCEKKLKCGHRCPGVCGEICPTSKFCEICATDDVKGQMVDYYEFKSFAEIDWEKERMIVLDCGHVFTMETMDRHMEMEKYYNYAESDYGNWTGIVVLSSQAGEGKFITCPTCRAPIMKIKRYGRPIKKRILDTQHKKFLTTYESDLMHQKQLLDAIVERLEAKRPKLFKILKSKTFLADNQPNNKNENNEYMDIVNPVSEVSIIEKLYQIEENNLIPEPHINLWKSHIEELLVSYQQLMKIMSETKSPPYKKAFEAAVTRLYNKRSETKVDPLISSLENIHILEETESPENQKERFEQTLWDVGLIAPHFDRRVYLDAFSQIVNVQKVMFEEAIQIISKLPEKEPHIGTPVLSTQKSWIKFCHNITDSINCHLSVITQISKERKYYRHLVNTYLESVEIECRVTRFDFHNIADNGFVTESDKKHFKQKCDEIAKRCDEILNDSLPTVEQEGFQEKCKERIDKVLKSVDELNTAVVKSGKLTQEEKLEITKAMNSEFFSAGHWYECPNGHPYTIGECGMAMQASRCPECGVPIGGGSHRLTAGNRRSSEYGGFESTWNQDIIQGFL